MKRYSQRRPSPKRTSKSGDRFSEDIAKQTREILNLLQQLALEAKAKEKVQRRFRIAMLHRVSRIETLVLMIHGGQIAEAHQGRNSRESANAADEFLSRESNKMAEAMVKAIYKESDEGARPRRGRKRRSD
jgi:hypothetical protein